MCSHSNIQLIILIIKYLIQFYPPLGRIGPNEVSGCPNRLSGAGGEPGYGGGIWGRRGVGGEMQRCVAAGIEDGAEAAGWGERVCRCGEWGQGRCRAARFENGAMVVQFPGRRCFRGRDEALGWGESWVSVSGDLSRGCVAQHAALWCRLCRAGPPCVMSRGGRSEREREGKLDRDRVFGAVNWPSGATHRGRRVTRRAAACRAGARGRGACA